MRYGGCGKEAERVTTEQQYFPGTSSAAAAAEGRQDRATDTPGWQGDERVRIGMIRDVGRVCVRFQSSVADAARKAQWNRTRKVRACAEVAGVC